MTADDKIKEVMDWVRRHGSHLELAGGFSLDDELRGMEKSHRAKAKMNYEKIESKLRELIKDDV